jgi:hypothetical protein
MKTTRGQVSKVNPFIQLIFVAGIIFMDSQITQASEEPQALRLEGMAPALRRYSRACNRPRMDGFNALSGLVPQANDLHRITQRPEYLRVCIRV